MTVSIAVYRDHSRNPQTQQPYRLAILRADGENIPREGDYLSVKSPEGGDDPNLEGFGSFVTRVRWEYSGVSLAGVNVYVE